MNIIPPTVGKKIHVIGFQPGDLLLEKIEEAIQLNNIKNGAVLSGVGTLKKCRLHYVRHTQFPPENVFYTLEEPLELVCVNGLIIEGEPHLHVTVSKGEEKTWGGHLEHGSEVLYLAEIAILEFDDLAACRRFDNERKISLLTGK
jgi:predicted DNA-binding protein with PD1-like motif